MKIYGLEKMRVVFDTHFFNLSFWITFFMKENMYVMFEMQKDFLEYRVIFLMEFYWL